MQFQGASSFLSINIDFEEIITAHILTKDTSLTSNVIEISKFLHMISIICHSYSLMHRKNKLLVIGYHRFGIETLYPSRVTSDNNLIDFIPPLPDLFSHLNYGTEKLLQAYDHGIRSPQQSSSNSCSRLSPALSKSLTVINRLQRLESIQSRILCVQFNDQQHQSYHSVMNCIFSAQKMGVLIDTLIMSNQDSLIMQQASFLTNGIYFKHPQPQDFLLISTMHFLVDNASRKSCLLPCQTMVDFKASCYCCQKAVEFAYMCSVCLTLLCSPPTDHCPVCETKVSST